MRARVAGARAATGDTLTFLDSHISCSIGWLEPCMYRIHQDRRHIVMPKIDGADRDFNYKAGGIELVGFNTGVVDHGIRLMKKDEFKGRTDVDPQPSPAMAGGLFSVDRSYFFEIGAFDEKMAHWGGENIEIGFRAWQCGGTIELIPCSRIAHVFGGMGAGCGWPGAPPGNINKWRAIEVWVDDEYKPYFSKFLPKPTRDIGDLTHMMELKKKLKCKSFDWFLKNAYPECWINQLKNAKFEGMLRNVGSGQCYNPGNFRNRRNDGGKMEPCATSRPFRGNTQYAWITKTDEYLINPPYGSDDIDQCLDAYETIGSKTSMYGCHGWGGKQKWIYDQETKFLRHGDNCFVHTEGDKALVKACDASNANAKWEWVKLDSDK